MAKKKKKKIAYVWCIAYVNRDYIDRAEEELKQYEYKKVEAYIPTVRILKKKFKGKDEFEQIPLLFNYGFFKIPLRDARNEEFLSTLRQRITCIYGWVKDCSKVLEEKPQLRMDNGGIKRGMPKTALATDYEIANMIEASKKMSIYSSDEMDKMSEGAFITLHGYPFDNMDAEVIKVHHNKKEVTVMLDPEGLMKEVTVSFDNVFYTVYKGFDESSKDKSLSEIEENNKRNIDKILHKVDIG